MTPAARLQAAIDLLDGFAASAFPADRFIREFFRARRYAGSKDRAAVTERVFDVFRHRAAYAWRMRGDTNRSLVIGSLLAEGLDEPAIAALVTGDGYGPAALRDDERAAIARPPDGEMPLAARGSFPEFLLPELERRFGGDLLPEMLALTERASVDLRVNTLKAIRTDVLRELGEAGFDAEPTPFAPHGIRIGGGKSTASLQQSKLFLGGAFEFQDEAAQIAAALCAVEPGMRVLDLAAGAGGKSLALAATMRNQGEIVACDIRRGALDQLEARAIRAGVGIIKTRLPEALAADEQFDVVLVDAPCSGTGTWRRQPELRWRLTPQRLDELTALQDRLLDQAATHVKRDGRFVYATCSILPRENDDRIQAFLERNPAFRLQRADTLAQPLSAPSSAITEFFKATPHTAQTDGFFTAVLFLSR